MRSSVPFAVLVAILAPLAAAPATASSGLDSVLSAHPADSLVAPLRSFEDLHGHEAVGADAVLMLGRLHYARGEYRQAADAFARAAARLDPARKNEARYWQGLSWLAMKEPSQARAALEEVAESTSPRRADARLGIALAWELAERPDRALDAIETLLAHDPGEAAPAGLERMIVLSERMHRPEAASRARSRLLREYPESIEAARAASPEAETPTVGPASSLAVQIGVFTSQARARSLRNSAKRAGFPGAEVVSRGEGRARSYVVRLGVFSNTEEAKKAGERATRRLGVSYHVVAAS